MGGIFLLHTPSAKRRPMLGLSAAPRWRQLPAIRTALLGARQRRIVRARVHSGHGDPTSSAGCDAALHLPTIDELRAFKVKRALLVVAGSNWAGILAQQCHSSAWSQLWSCHGTSLLAQPAVGCMHSCPPFLQTCALWACLADRCNIHATPGATSVSLLLISCCASCESL